MLIISELEYSKFTDSKFIHSELSIMRIIGGMHKGRRFNPPAKNWRTRPTTDYAKEGLFNILINQIDFEQTKVLDLFCGTGNIAYECISRGSTDVTCVDKFHACIKFIKETAILLKAENTLTAVKSDVFKFIQKCDTQYDFIFADPPYALPKMNDIPDLIFQHKLMTQDALLVLEHGAQRTFENHPNFDSSRKYGDSVFSFFTHS